MAYTNIALNQLSLLTKDETDLVNEMLGRLVRYENSNAIKEKYYEGTQRVRQLNIAIPPHLQSIETVVGWAGTTVDVLAERLDWQGWTAYDGNDFGLGDIYSENGLDVDAGLGITDALIYGTSFIVVGSGFDGEPHPLITVESARNMTGIFDARSRRLGAALGVNKRKDGKVEEVTLYLPNENIRAYNRSGVWIALDRDPHNLGRVLVAQMFNNPRASQPGGRSEITKAIRSYTDQGVRTMLGMEINREFYSFPQRWMMGANLDFFKDENGNPIPGWEAVMTKMLVAPHNEDSGMNPVVGQFTPASPAPYLDQIKGLAQLVAAEAAIPSSYLGFVTDNPTSADAIRQAEARLIKRAERRQLMFGRAWTEAGRLALLVRDGEIPAEYNGISSKWRDAATPTRAAAADEVVKLAAAGVLPAESEVVLDRIGLNPQEKRQVAADRRRANATQRVADLRAAVEGTTEEA